MKYILSFNCIPTLSRYLYYMPRYKYLYYHKKETKNKAIILSIKDIDTKFNVLNEFKYDYIKIDNSKKNKFITSNFVLNGIYKNKTIHIYEHTYFEDCNMNEKIFVKYKLCLKLNNLVLSNILYEEYFNSDVKFTNDLWNNMSEDNYKIIKNIDDLINKNNSYFINKF